MDLDFTELKLYLKRVLPPFLAGLVIGGISGLVIAWNNWLVIFILQAIILLIMVNPFRKKGPRAPAAKKWFKALEQDKKEPRHYKPCEHCGSRTVHKKGCPKNV